jgi:hypothetical protein
MPPGRVPESKNWPIWHRQDPRLSRLPSFPLFLVAVLYISIFLHTLMYKDIRKFMSLPPCVVAALAGVSWASWTRARHALCPW